MRVVPAPDPSLSPAQQDRRFYRDVLHELINMGMDLARAAYRAAAPDPRDPPEPESLATFDRIARAVRRTVLLATRLDDPPRPRTPPLDARKPPNRPDARPEASRESPDRETVTPDRLDPLETDLPDHPVADSIAQLRTELGLEPGELPRPRTEAAPAATALGTAAPDTPAKGSARPAVNAGPPSRLLHRLE